MKPKKILIIRKGDFYIYVFDIASALINEELDVDILLHDSKINKEPLYKELYDKLLSKYKKNIYFIMDKNNGFFQKILFRISHKLFYNNIYKKLKKETYKHITEDHINEYDFFLAIGQESLLWVHKLGVNTEKIIYYNLEAIDKTNPVYKKKYWKYLIDFEQKIISNIACLIIQDDLRAKVILNENFDKVKFIKFPVSINNYQGFISQKSQYFHQKYKLDTDIKLLLYYGGLWEGRYLNELIDLSNGFPNKLKLIIHGGRGNWMPQHTSNNAILSTESISFFSLNKIITSAYIGIALYDNSNYNERYTAFSSEKVFRYCQAAIPFIAFDNESYRNLKAKFDCCELITNIYELLSAIKKIDSNYEYYQINALSAYNNCFKFDIAIKPIINYIVND